MFKSLIKPFYGSDGDDGKTTAVKPSQAEEAALSASHAGVSIEPVASAPIQRVPQPVNTPTGAINDDMLTMLSNAIDEANLEGFDYIEFRDTLVKMDGNGMAEKNKFLAVFITAQSMGLTQEKLITSIEHYLGVIGKHRDGFIQEVESLLQRDVQDPLDNIEHQNQKIEDARNKIVELNSEIATTQQEILDTQNNANTRRMEIENTRSSFDTTFGFVSGQLESDKNKIIQYLGTPKPATETATTEGK